MNGLPVEVMAQDNDGRYYRQSLCARAPYPRTVMGTELAAPARTYRVRTYGCQMNVHDSERLSGLLEEAGYTAAPEGADADVVVLNTCAVRENADNRLYGNLGHLRPVKDAHPGMQIAVGGCLAQKDRGEIVRRAPWVDVVFGTHNVGSLPALLDRARHNAEAQVEIVESLEVFPSTLPAKRDSAYSGWVSISVGCNNTCTFCIVPALRGTEKDRRPGEILAEVQALVDQGVLEVTLLGQNVNAYGVEFRDRGAFADLLRAAGRDRGAGAGPVHQPAPPRVHRRRHRTRWPRRRRSATSCTCRCSRGPTTCCAGCAAATGRSATSGSSTGCAPRCPTRRSPPTSSWASPARPRPTSSRRSTSSARPGSPAPSPSSTPSARARPAAEMDGQLPKDVVQERYLRLTALQDEISWAENRAQVGRRVELLVAAGEGSKDAATGRLSGRARDGRLVHFTAARRRPARRRRRDGRDRRQAALPGRRRRAALAPAHPGRGTPPRRASGRRRRASCSGCPDRRPRPTSRRPGGC